MICGDVPENMMSALKLMPPMVPRRSAPTTNAFGICPYSKYSMMLNIKGITIPRMTTRPQKFRLSIPDVNIVAEMAASVDLVKDMNTRSIKNRASTERNITCPSAKLDKVLIVFASIMAARIIAAASPVDTAEARNSTGMIGVFQKGTPLTTAIKTPVYVAVATANRLPNFQGPDIFFSKLTYETNLI